MLKKTFLVIIVAVAVFAPAAVHAEVSAGEREALIRERCADVKVLVDQQERRDLVSRINRGREYQNIVTQVEAMATRMRNNKLSAVQVDQQVAQLKGGIDSFRATYNRYDNTVAALLKIDCRNRPTDFALQLDIARNLRAAVSVEITSINASMSRYREIVVNFQAELERLNNAVLGEQAP